MGTWRVWMEGKLVHSRLLKLGRESREFPSSSPMGLSEGSGPTGTAAASCRGTVAAVPRVLPIPGAGSCLGSHPAVPCSCHVSPHQVKCYHKKYRSATRDVIFRLQFHTGAVQGYGLVFGKEDLDSASKGEALPAPGRGWGRDQGGAQGLGGARGKDGVVLGAGPRGRAGPGAAMGRGGGQGRGPGARPCRAWVGMGKGQGAVEWGGARVGRGQGAETGAGCAQVWFSASCPLPLMSPPAKSGPSQERPTVGPAKEASLLSEPPRPPTGLGPRVWAPHVHVC